MSSITTKELEKLKESGGSADKEELMKNVIAIAYGGKAMLMTDIKTKLISKTAGADTVSQKEQYWSAFTSHLTDCFGHNIVHAGHGASPRYSEEGPGRHRSNYWW